MQHTNNQCKYLVIGVCIIPYENILVKHFIKQKRIAEIKSFLQHLNRFFLSNLPLRTRSRQSKVSIIIEIPHILSNLKWLLSITTLIKLKTTRVLNNKHFL